VARTEPQYLQFMNRNVQVRISAYVHLGDAAEPGDIDGYTEEVDSTLCGFICGTQWGNFANNPTSLIDYSPGLPASNFIPKWIHYIDYGPNASSIPQDLSVPAVVCDTTGLLLNSVRHFRADGVNGSVGSGDGMGIGIWSGEATSAWASTNPACDYYRGQLGQANGGVNWSGGVAQNNSSLVSSYVGNNVVYDSIVLNGFGGIAIGMYGNRYSTCSNVTIHAPDDCHSSPITIGCIGPKNGVVGAADWYRAFSNKVSNCHIEWTNTNGCAIAEDNQYGEFAATDHNYIDSSNTYTCGNGDANHLFWKIPTTSSSSKQLTLYSVSGAATAGAAAPDNRWVCLQVEGTSGGLTSPPYADNQLKAYSVRQGSFKQNGTMFTATVDTFYANQFGLLRQTGAVTFLDNALNLWSINAIQCNGVNCAGNINSKQGAAQISALDVNSFSSGNILSVYPETTINTAGTVAATSGVCTIGYYAGNWSAGSIHIPTLSVNTFSADSFSPANITAANITATNTATLRAVSIGATGNPSYLYVNGTEVFDSGQPPTLTAGNASLRAITCTSLNTGGGQVTCGTLSCSTFNPASLTTGYISCTSINDSGSITCNGITNSGGIQAVGYNLPNGVYGATMSIGIVFTGSAYYFYTQANPTVYMHYITVQGGVITGLGN
jgi:hypothetical protein